MNAKIKEQLDTIASACRLLSDNDTNRIKVNSAMIQTMINHNDGVLSEARSAEKLQKIILDAGDIIAWELFGQASITVNSEEKAVSSSKLMAGHERLLDAFTRRAGRPVTIKTLEKDTGLKRTTIWTYVPALRKEGHLITVNRKKGGLPFWSYEGKAA